MMPVTGASDLFSGNVGDAILSADSASLFVSSGNDVVRIDVATGSEIARYNLGTRAGALDVSADGKRLAVVEPDTGNRVGLINLATGAVTHRTVPKPDGATLSLRDVSFTGNDSLLLSQERGALLSYDVKTAALTTVLSKAPGAVLISSDDHSNTFILEESLFHRSATYKSGSGVEWEISRFPDPYAGASLPTIMQLSGAISRDGRMQFQGDGGFLTDYTSYNFTSFGGSAADGYAFGSSLGKYYSIDDAGNLLVRATSSGYVLDASDLFVPGTHSDYVLKAYYVGLTLKQNEAQFGADPATKLGNVLQITDDGRYAIVMTADGISRLDLQTLVPMSSEGDDIITVGNTLYGLGGKDTLGGAGFQTLIGGRGDDLYLLDPGERAIESQDAGTDTVRTAAAFYALPDNIENLTSTATAQTFLTANALNNVILGGSGDDTIDGGGGTDLIDGGAGNDTIQFSQLLRRVAISLAVSGEQITNGRATVTLRSIENLGGSGFNDILIGNRAANIIEGNFGNDRLDGGAGADKMRGGYGNDTYIVENVGDVADENSGDGVDTVVSSVSFTLGDGVERLELVGMRNLAGTGNGNDNVLTGNAGNNVLDGGDGNDRLFGGAGNDTLFAGDQYTYFGNDGLDGGEGIDTVSYANATSSVFVSLAIRIAQNTSGAGSDTLINLENLTGSSFSDVLSGNAGNNGLSGGDGDDTLLGGAGDDVLAGGRGLDTASYDGAKAAITVDLVLAGPQDTSGAGLDTLSSIENLEGGLRGDRLSGDARANRLSGGAGGDTLIGQGGADTLDGGAGDDRLDGGNGADIMVGGAGSDSYLVDNAADQVVETASGAMDDTSDAGGVDSVEASVSFSLAVGGAQFVENLKLLGLRNANATGNDLANLLNGNSGANQLFGGLGNDTLQGDLGDDVLSGGAGRDLLEGGAGKDRFVFDSLTVSADRDTIVDFVQGEDVIQISRSVFTAYANASAGPLDASAFVVGIKALTADQHLIYNAGKGRLYYDADGSGSDPVVLLAILANKPALVEADIVLI